MWSWRVEIVGWLGVGVECGRLALCGCLRHGGEDCSHCGSRRCESLVLCGSLQLGGGCWCVGYIRLCVACGVGSVSVMCCGVARFCAV